MVRCKKIIRNAAAVVLSLSLLTGIASAAFGSGTVTAKALRLREEATSASATLDTARKGTQVTVLEDVTNGFYKVDLNGTVGFMSAEYLDVVADETPDAPAPALEAGESLPVDEVVDETAEVETETVLARVNASSLNVRAGAGTGYDRVGKLKSGAVVTVLSQANGWAQISTDDLTGYVSAEYLTIVDEAALAAASTQAGQLVELATQYLGVRYKYGGTSPSGFDCSGYVYYLFKTLGVSVPRTASAQWAAGYAKVDKSDLRPGDLVFFTNTMRSSNYITHVGIYVGDGQFIHSSSPSSGGVIYSSLSEGYYGTRYAGACRVFG